MLPRPRRLERGRGLWALPARGLILLDSAEAAALRPLAAALQAAAGRAGAAWEVTTSAAPEEQVVARLNVGPAAAPHEQGYELVIGGDGIHITGASAAGVFYGLQTLWQLLEPGGNSLPYLRCRDWPDFDQRGVMLDISRDKVPAMATLYELVDLLASWKINQLQLYTEHTFAYSQHPQVWAEASPMTGEEILALDAYCRQRFVELVPNQNSFGHMRRWLVHEAYRHLAECPEGCDTSWGHFDDPFSLYPGEPGSLALLRGLYDELLPHFHSRQFNVGCDETVDLGRGRSAAAVAERGAGRVYLDFLVAIHQEVIQRQHTMQFWGDVVINYPELVAEIPHDTIALEWGYEASHPFAAHCAIYAGAGLPFYVCPGTSSWNSIAGRTENALANMRAAAASGRLHGAAGYLNTDWGDNGHWQPLPVSYLPFAYGAAVAWAGEANEAVDAAAAASAFAFADPSGAMGQAAAELGNLYTLFERQPDNASLLFQTLQRSPAEIVAAAAAGTVEKQLQPFRRALDRLDEIASRLAPARSGRADGDLVKRELGWAAAMLRHACWRAIWALGGEDMALTGRLDRAAAELLEEFEAVWLARNRPGGLRESRQRLLRMKADYRQEN